MNSSTSKLPCFLAIVSIVVSTVLSLTHHHLQDDSCCDASHQHAVATAPIAGLEDLSPSDHNCDCDCRSEQFWTASPATEGTDSDSCSLCRLVYEDAIESNDAMPLTVCHATFDTLCFTVQLSLLDVEILYLNRGPPTRR